MLEGPDLTDPAAYFEDAVPDGIGRVEGIAIFKVLPPSLIMPPSLMRDVPIELPDRAVGHQRQQRQDRITHPAHRTAGRPRPWSIHRPAIPLDAFLAGAAAPWLRGTYERARGVGRRSDP